MRSVPISPKTAPVAVEGRSEIDMIEVLDILRRGKWIIAAWVVLAMLLGGYYAFRMTTPLYKSTVTIALQNRAESVVDLATPIAGLSGDFFTINTEVEAMAARDLVEKLVDKYDLVSDPAFNYALRPIDDGWSPGQAIGAVRTWITDLVTPVEPEPEVAELTEEERRLQTREDVIQNVLRSISVANKEASYVFYITAMSDRPTAAARLANGMAEVYIEDQIQTKFEANERATAWLNGRVAELETDLEAAENAVKDFSAASNLIGSESLADLDRQLKLRRERIEDVRTETETLASRLAALEAARASGEPAAMAAAADELALSQILDRIDAAGMRQAFDARYERILSRTRLDANQAADKLAALERSVAELSERVQGQSAELLELQQLEREATASRQLYEYFLGRLKEISIQQGVHRADSRVLSKGIVPVSPSAPRKTVIVAIAMLLGFLIGAAFVILREMRQTGFRSSQELERATGVPVLAQIPSAPVNKRRRLVRYLASKQNSALAESVRNLRTSVILSSIDKPPQVIMTTSSLPGEGKTTQSVALAHSFAGMGRRVLLIEGDIRRRTFREYFRLTGSRGLISAVLDDTPLEEIVHHSKSLGIDVLAGEKSGVNAADFFSSVRVEEFLDRARREYDILIIDTPPVLVVPDARVIGGLADAVLYLVRWNWVSEAQVEQGLSMLSSIDVKVSGLVLSQVDFKRAADYGGRYGNVYQAYGSKYYRS